MQHTSICLPIQLLFFVYRKLLLLLGVCFWFCCDMQCHNSTRSFCTPFSCSFCYSAGLNIHQYKSILHGAYYVCKYFSRVLFQWNTPYVYEKYALFFLDGVQANLLHSTNYYCFTEAHKRSVWSNKTQRMIFITPNACDYFESFQQ